MILSTEDAKLYYSLWKPLLDYVNKKYKVNDQLPQIAEAEGMDATEVKKVADRLWEDVSVIDDYLAEPDNDLSEEHREIVEGWKRRIMGRFILERHLKKGSIFISIDNNEVYQVSGITTSWEEMFWNRKPPIMLSTVLLPFKDVIIYDSLAMPYNIFIGGNMAKELKGIYMAAKKSGMLHKML